MFNRGCAGLSTPRSPGGHAAPEIGGCFVDTDITGSGCSALSSEALDESANSVNDDSVAM